MPLPYRRVGAGIWNSYKLHPLFSFIFKIANFVAGQNLNLTFIKIFFRAGCNPRPAVKVRESRVIGTDLVQIRDRQ